MKQRIIICCVLLFSISAFAISVSDPRIPDKDIIIAKKAQVEQGKHELSLHAFAGTSKIDYPDMGGIKWSPGFGAAITYNFFFLPRWSFLTGGGLQLFNNRGAAEDASGYMRTRDNIDGQAGDEVWLYYNFEGYSENQWSLMFTIPVMFQYTSNESRKAAFYYALGAKLGIPFAGAYESKIGSAKICGQYWKSEIQGDYSYAQCNEQSSQYPGFGVGFEQGGFGDFGKVSSHSKLKLGTALFAAAEAGLKWRLYNKFAIYTGFWLDWALNDVAVDAVTNDPFKWTPKAGDPNPPTSYGGSPWATVDFNSRTQNSKAIPVSMGFTVRFSLGGGNLYPEVDSLRWLKRLYSSDSMLELRNEDLARMKRDSLRTADSIDYLNFKAEALLDSFVYCRYSCMMGGLSKEEQKSMMDSLARENERRRQTRLQTANLTALENSIQNSFENYRRLEEMRETRLMEFRKKLNSADNGLDDYSVTQMAPGEKAIEKLDSAAKLLKDYPDLRLRIIGHSCDLGNHETSMRSGRQRAESARNYLTQMKDVDVNRLEIQSRADLEPVVPNKDEESRRKNRRIQLEIIEGAEDTHREDK
jgi:outer membrane protein OmpA-like peptidoglycan-associated protein